LENNTQYVQQDTIDLRELFAVLKRRKKMIWSVTGIITLLAVIYAFLIAAPIYQTTAQIKLAQINKKPIDNTNNMKQELETIFEVNAKNKKIEFPLVKSITVPKGTSNILTVRTQGYDNGSVEKKLLSVFEYITTMQSKDLESYIKTQKRRLVAAKDNLRQESELLSSSKKSIRDYQNKLLTISERNVALAGIYSIEIGKQQNQIKSLTDQIFQLKNSVNNIEDSLSPFKIRNAEIIGKIERSDKPIKPKKKLIVVVAFITGLMLSIFLAFFLEFMAGMKKPEEN